MKVFTILLTKAACLSLHSDGQGRPKTTRYKKRNSTTVTASTHASPRHITPRTIVFPTSYTSDENENSSSVNTNSNSKNQNGKTSPDSVFDDINNRSPKTTTRKVKKMQRKPSRQDVETNDVGICSPRQKKSTKKTKANPKSNNKNAAKKIENKQAVICDKDGKEHKIDLTPDGLISKPINIKNDKFPCVFILIV